MMRMQLISFYTIWALLLVHIFNLLLVRPAQKDGDVSLSSNEVNEMEVFQDIRFYLTEEEKPRVNFESSRLEVLPTQAKFISPSGNVYDEKGRDLFFKSESGSYSRENNTLSLFGKVKLNYEDFLLTCENGFYDLNKKLFKGKGKVVSNGIDNRTKDKLKIKSQKVYSYPMKKWSRFDGDVTGRISRKRKYQGSFDFEAEQIQVDLLKSKVDLKEDVKIKRTNMLLSAQNSSIFLENYTKKLKYYELSDDVVIKQTFRERASGRTIKRTAYSEKLEGFVKDRKVILTGAPRVLSNQDIIRGSRIVLRENASIVEVDDSTSRINYRNQK